MIQLFSLKVWPPKFWKHKDLVGISGEQEKQCFQKWCLNRDFLHSTSGFNMLKNVQFSRERESSTTPENDHWQKNA